MSRDESFEADAGPNAEPQRKSRLRRVIALLRNRPDSEHEISINRIAISLLVFFYWVGGKLAGSESTVRAIEHLEAPLAFVAISGVLLFGHLLAQPGVSHVRRVLGMVVDIGALTVALHMGDAGTALFYPIYLWAILGNGFRYGVVYLAIAAAMSIVGFVFVIMTAPFWREHVHLGISLALALLVLPAYTSVLIRKLSAARVAAEEASRAKTMFLASVSHELRTPLNAIVGLSDLLCDSRLDADQREMARTIGKSGRSLTSLINAILDVSRMEIGKLPTKTEIVDLPGLLGDIRSMLAVQGNAKSVRVSVHLSHDTPHRVLLNRSHMEEILVNLGGNAVKFTHSGDVLIYVSRLSEKDNRVRLRFEVRDTGIGIAEEARSRIFERFSQADETIIDRYGGTGLGLAIVKQLVEGGGGSIGVESAVGYGSTFWFEIEAGVAEPAAAARPSNPVALISADRGVRARFAEACADLRSYDVLEDFLAAESRLPAGGARPIVALDEHSIGAVFDEAASWFLARSEDRPWPVIWLRDGSPPPQSIDALRLFTTTLGRSADAAGVAQAILLAAATCPSEQPKDAPSARGEGLDILVAEDNKTNQMVIRKILQQAGHSVTLAENGEQAIEALGARRFDLVLMDLNMPVLNGIEAAKLARFIDLETDPVPIVALTADATEETRAKCLEAGMNDCLTKPIDRPKLLAWLEDFERQKPQHRLRASMEEPALPVETAGAHAPAGDEALDARALGDLESLGGKEFVEQIAEQFVRDAAGVLKELSQAVAQGDAQAFREHAHALRSCAANVGARKVYNLCLSWRAIDAAEVAVRGEEHVRALETEFGRARAQLGL